MTHRAHGAKSGNGLIDAALSLETRGERSAYPTLRAPSIDGEFSLEIISIAKMIRTVGKNSI